ncbi:DUF2963 domain-containing protein [Candidatus Phytoplasma pruni]|uniref:DUF2963 domain-containing protein n=1 Tax=Candidatus Phytoplasma pruni TaxID=479893 RepID=A0A851HAF5_9MOLU|nr:DUF2963 domain-containing protein [Candidatus Phytoplasma pruni]
MNTPKTINPPAENSTPNNKTTTHINENDYKVITEYNNLNQITKKTHYSSHIDPPDFDNKNNYYLYFIQIFDPQTNKKIKETTYNSDGTKTIDEYGPDGIISSTEYNPDESIHYIEEYSPENNNLIKTTWFHDGRTYHIEEYHPQTGNKTKFTSYYPNGNIKTLEKFKPHSGKLIKSTTYYPKGSIKFILIYNPKKDDPQSRTIHY